MKREIKFRGKRLDQDKWLHGDLIHINGAPLISDPTANIGFDRAFVNPESVGQYTGLKDRNGKEIYEDDIVEVKTGYCGIPKFHEHTYQLAVAYNNKGCYVGLKDATSIDLDCSDIYSIEVIGNIHDNPELLKGGNHAD